MVDFGGGGGGGGIRRGGGAGGFGAGFRWQTQNIEQENGTPQVDKSADGHPISLAGQTFDHGLGVQTPSRIVIKLGGAATHFTATVGVDDEVKGKDGGTVVFTVSADGTQVFPRFQGIRGPGFGPGGGGGPGGAVGEAGGAGGADSEPRRWLPAMRRRKSIWISPGCACWCCRRVHPMMGCRTTTAIGRMHRSNTPDPNPRSSRAEG